MAIFLLSLIPDRLVTLLTGPVILLLPTWEQDEDKEHAFLLCLPYLSWTNPGAKEKGKDAESSAACSLVSKGEKSEG